MINIRLRGGLGNQMFQYALGRSLELRGREVTYDLSRVHRFSDERPHNRNLPQYGLDGWHTDVKEGGTVGQVYHGNVAYDDKAFGASGDTTLDGYWQSEKFFYVIKQTINREFYPKNLAPHLYLPTSSTIVRTALQVRRGDYIQYADFHGPLPAEYYREGLKAVGGGTVYVFTDDVEWVTANEKEIFQGREWVLGNTGNRHADITMMSFCTNIVIANSSFGWWGAWLGEWRTSDHKVVAPKQWFGPTNTIDTKDIVPERWIKI